MRNRCGRGVFVNFKHAHRVLGDPDQIREHDKEKGMISHNVFLVKKTRMLRINGKTHEHEHYEKAIYYDDDDYGAYDDYERE